MTRMCAMDFSANNLHDLAVNLQQRHCVDYNIPFLKTSAIMLIINPTYPSPQLLMTARSEKLKHHSGEMSFPGGKFDKSRDASLQNTAIREVEEEIGLKYDNYKILGRMDDFATLTGFVIRPFIGVLHRAMVMEDFLLNSEEVADLVLIPFSTFIPNNPFQERLFSGYKDRRFSYLDFTYADPLREKQFYIWGASAHIIASFFEVFTGKPYFSGNYSRPSVIDISEYYSMKKEGKIGIQ